MGFDRHSFQSFVDAFFEVAARCVVLFADSAKAGVEWDDSQTIWSDIVENTC